MNFTFEIECDLRGGGILLMRINIRYGCVIERYYSISIKALNKVCFGLSSEEFLPWTQGNNIIS